MTIGLETLKNRAVPLIVSIALQSVLGTFLGQQYDMQIFYTSGYVVSKGISPYGIFPTRAIFNNPNFFQELPGIGYPPPWGLYLALVYTVVYVPTGNLFAYNLAIKLPSIISNIALAFILERIAIQEGVKKEDSKKIFYFFLFNPLMIYISAVWGQFDSLVILTTILGINDLFHGRIKRSGLFFALSGSLKVIPLVLALVFLIFVKRNYSLKKILEFTLTSLAAFTIFSFLPFKIFGWNLWSVNRVVSDPGYQFDRAGGFTFFNILELTLGTTNLPQGWEFLGYVWIPSVIVGYYQLSRTPLASRMDLIRWASASLFILTLTRTWVSEQNILLLIPLVMLYSIVNHKNWKLTHMTWIITLVFTFMNGSPFQMFFLLSPEPYNLLRLFDQAYINVRFVLRFLTVIPWNVLGWLYIWRTIHVQ
jgi:Gpi18-like mannosyltransferase